MGALLLAVALLQGGLPMTTIDRGPISGIDRPTQVVVRTAADWAALWQRHESGKALPDVDFSREMVLAVAAGSRPTGGWEVDILGVERAADAVVVRYTIRGPQRGQIAASIVTSPFQFVRVPAVDGPVRFERVNPPPRP